MIDANYMIAALLRMLIKELSDPSANEDMKKLYIEDFKECIKNYCEKASEESSEELQDIKDYMECLIKYANDSKQLLTVLNGNVSENEVLENIENETETESKTENDDDEKKNKFIHHVLADKKNQISELLEMMDITLEVVNLGMEELEKYLPSTPSTEEQKKLLNTKGNVSE